MWKYIVTYLIIKTTTIPCKMPEPQPDEFGRMPTLLMQTAQICYVTDTVKMSKTFAVRDSALAFIGRGTDNGQRITFSVSDLGVLANFQLDSVKVKNRGHRHEYLSP
jgi:hypothetical protein